MGKDAKWKNKGDKKSGGGDKPKPVKAAVAKGADGKPAMQSLGDALKHKPGYKAGGGKGSAGAGKGANKSYKKSWEKSAKKYNADKKDNDSAANFRPRVAK